MYILFERNILKATVESFQAPGCIKLVSGFAQWPSLKQEGLMRRLNSPKTYIISTYSETNPLLRKEVKETYLHG